MDDLLKQSTAQRQRRSVPLPGQVGQIKDSFKKADKDGNGTIDADELADLLYSLNPDLGHNNSKLLFAAADINGDNKLDFGEFMEWMFSDVDEAEVLLIQAARATAAPSAGGLRQEDPESVVDFEVEAKINAEFSNAYKSFLLTYPDCAEPAQRYVDEQKQRLMSPEFAKRVGGSFGTRLDKNGDGTLSYYEVKDLIKDVLQADNVFPPDANQIHEFFDRHCTDAFGNQMGANQFVDLMRMLNVHLMGRNLVLLQSRWKQEVGAYSGPTGVGASGMLGETGAQSLEVTVTGLGSTGGISKELVL